VIFEEVFLLPELPRYIIQLFNHVVKIYENCWNLKLLLKKMLCENFKEKNKNSICSELPKIAIFPKKHFGLLGINQNS